MANHGVAPSSKLTITAPTYDIKVVKKVAIDPLVPRSKYFDLLDAIDTYINHIRVFRKNQKALDKALSITKEMRFIAMFSYKFRLETYAPLEELFDDLYFEVHE